MRTEPSEFVEPGGSTYQMSYCAWTTVDRLGFSTYYWTRELPEKSDLADDHVRDGGQWMQPFPYSKIAHLIIPQEFDEEHVLDGVFRQWTHFQDIVGLSLLLEAEGIPHRLHATFLEVRTF